MHASHILLQYFELLFYYLFILYSCIGFFLFNIRHLECEWTLAAERERVPAAPERLEKTAHQPQKKKKKKKDGMDSCP